MKLLRREEVLLHWSTCRRIAVCIADTNGHLTFSFQGPLLIQYQNQVLLKTNDFLSAGIGAVVLQVYELRYQTNTIKCKVTKALYDTKGYRHHAEEFSHKTLD